MVVTTSGDEIDNRLWRRVDHQGEFITFEVIGTSTDFRFLSSG